MASPFESRTLTVQFRRKIYITRHTQLALLLIKDMFYFLFMFGFHLLKLHPFDVLVPILPDQVAPELAAISDD